MASGASRAEGMLMLYLDFTNVRAEGRLGTLPYEQVRSLGPLPSVIMGSPPKDPGDTGPSNKLKDLEHSAHRQSSDLPSHADESSLMIVTFAKKKRRVP